MSAFYLTGWPNFRLVKEQSSHSTKIFKKYVKFFFKTPRNSYLNMPSVGMIEISINRFEVTSAFVNILDRKSSSENLHKFPNKLCWNNYIKLDSSHINTNFTFVLVVHDNHPFLDQFLLITFYHQKYPLSTKSAVLYSRALWRLIYA